MTPYNIGDRPLWVESAPLNRVRDRGFQRAARGGERTRT